MYLDNINIELPERFTTELWNKYSKVGAKVNVTYSVEKNTLSVASYMALDTSHRNIKWSEELYSFIQSICESHHQGHDCSNIVTPVKHISEILANMDGIHSPMKVTGKGELKSCVELSEDDVLRKKLMTVSDNSVIGMAIRMGAENNLEATKKMIKDQINDNAEMMTELLGSDLMQEFSYGK
jgi:negative regulator of replication initiation